MDGSGDGVMELARRNAIHRQCLAVADGGDDDGEAMAGNKYAGLHAGSAHGMAHQVLNVVASFHAVVAGDVVAGEDGGDDDEVLRQ